MGREIGNSTRAAVAINPESGGTSFGQTPGTKTVFTTLAGGAKWEKKQAKTTLTLMGFQESLYLLPNVNHGLPRYAQSRSDGALCDAFGLAAYSCLGTGPK